MVALQETTGRLEEIDERCAFDVGEEEEERGAIAAARAESIAALALLAKAAARADRGAAGAGMAMPQRSGVERELLRDIIVES